MNDLLVNERKTKKPKRFALRCSLRWLLALVLIVALGMVGYQRVKKSQTGRAIIDGGATIKSYCYESVGDRNIESFDFAEGHLLGANLYQLPYLKEASFGQERLARGSSRRSDIGCFVFCDSSGNIHLSMCANVSISTGYAQALMMFCLMAKGVGCRQLLNTKVVLPFFSENANPTVASC